MPIYDDLFEYNSFIYLYNSLNFSLFSQFLDRISSSIFCLPHRVSIQVLKIRFSNWFVQNSIDEVVVLIRISIPANFTTSRNSIKISCHHYYPIFYICLPGHLIAYQLPSMRLTQGDTNAVVHQSIDVVFQATASCVHKFCVGAKWN